MEEKPISQEELLEQLRKKLEESERQREELEINFFGKPNNAWIIFDIVHQITENSFTKVYSIPIYSFVVIHLSAINTFFDISLANFKKGIQTKIVGLWQRENWREGRVNSCRETLNLCKYSLSQSLQREERFYNKSWLQFCR